MDPLSDVLRRLLDPLPDVPETLREELVRAGGRGHQVLLELFQRRAAETVSASREHHRKIEALIRRP